MCRERDHHIAELVNKLLRHSHDRAICAALEGGQPGLYHVYRAAELAIELESLVSILDPAAEVFVGRPSPWPPIETPHDRPDPA